MNIKNFEFKSEELKFLQKRGLLKALTHPEKLDEKIKNQKITFYIGFDCTAPSLHIGHLIPIMIARFLIKMGHKAIIILGTTTAKIGDPSGKNQTRKMLSEDDIKNNFNHISENIKKFLEPFSNGENIIFLQNNWLEQMSLVSFLRDFGSLFSVNKMVNMETFRSRLENHQNLSFLEFTYSLFQAYDFFHLNKEFDCILQIGGSDQWGNIIAGIEFGEKILPNKDFFGMTSELLLNSSGEKMGKTLSGAIWLDEKLLSPFEYWQYFRNIDDDDVLKIFNMLSDFEDSEIKEFSEKIKSNEINSLKIILATRLTEICHGKEKALEAENLAKQKFSIQNGSLENLKADFFLEIQKKNQEIKIKDKSMIVVQEYDFNIQLLEILKLCAKENSNTELRKLASQNAIKVNGKIVCDTSIKIIDNEIFRSKFLIEIGKKRKFVFEILDI